MRRENALTEAVRTKAEGVLAMPHCSGSYMLSAAEVT